MYNLVCRAHKLKINNFLTPKTQLLKTVQNASALWQLKPILIISFFRDQSKGSKISFSKKSEFAVQMEWWRFQESLKISMFGERFPGTFSVSVRIMSETSFSISLVWILGQKFSKITGFHFPRSRRDPA